MITIGSYTISNWQSLKATVQMRIIALSEFVTIDGKTIQAGNPDTGPVYQTVVCTPNLSAKTLTIPSVKIDTTTDSLTNQDVRYAAFFYSGKEQIGVFQGFERFIVPPSLSAIVACVPLSGTTVCYDWGALRVYNAAFIPVADDTTYTKGQINALLTSISGGVDLTTNQTIAGNKTFQGITKFGTGTNINDPAWANTGATALLFQGADSTLAAPLSSANPSGVYQTYRTGGSIGVSVFGYEFGFSSVGAGGTGGDTYAVGILNRFSRDLTGFANGDYFHTGLKAHQVLSPTNKPAGVNIYGFNEIRTERTVAGIRAVGLQVQCDNNSSVDSEDYATTTESTISLNIAAGGNHYNGVGVQFETGITGSTSFAVGFWPKANSIRKIINDYSYNGAGTYDVAGGAWSSSRTVLVTNGSPNIVGTGTRFLKELMKGDQVTVDGVTWYELTADPSDDTHCALTVNYAGSTLSGQPLLKTVIPFRLNRPTYITAYDGTNTYKLIGMDASNKVRLDNNGRGVYAGTNFTANNNFTQKVMIGAIATQEQYPGIWFGSATPDLTNFAFLYESGLNATILNGTSGVYFRVSNVTAWVITGANHYIPNVTNSFDIGDATHLVRRGYFTDVNVPSLTPSSSADATGSTGDIRWDSGFCYIKTGAGAWKRTALSAF